MRLYIVRHGFAGEHGDPNYPDDTLRPLTEKGRKRFRRVAKALAERGVAPTVVVTSPLVRCRQTAEILVAKASPRAELTEHEALRPGSQLEQLVAWSNDQQASEIAWVGHAPDVDELCAALAGGREGLVAFAKGAVAAIDFDDEIVAGEGTLRWFVSPKILGC